MFGKLIKIPQTRNYRRREGADRRSYEPGARFGSDTNLENLTMAFQECVVGKLKPPAGGMFHMFLKHKPRGVPVW